MRRVAFVGTPGSGKSTLARRLAERDGLAHIELDALFHQPGWTQAPREEFRASVAAAMAAAEGECGGWTVCGNYTDALAAMHTQRADTIVWLDLPRITTVRRVLSRTLRRGIRREVLWNGNQERLLNIFKPDPDDNVVKWAWVKHPEYAAKYEEATASGDWNHAEIIRLRTPKAVEDFAR